MHSPPWYEFHFFRIKHKSRNIHTAVDFTFVLRDEALKTIAFFRGGTNDFCHTRPLISDADQLAAIAYPQALGQKGHFRRCQSKLTHLVTRRAMFISICSNTLWQCSRYSASRFLSLISKVYLSKVWSEFFHNF